MDFTPFVVFVAANVVALVLLAGILHSLPRLGTVGRRISKWCQQAPGLDLVVTVFTALPWGIGGLLRGWSGVLAAVIGQVIAVHLWVLLHEWAHRGVCKGPRILKVLNATVGPVRNYTALWVTALVIPMFWLVRLAEWVLYPLLVILVRFPWYKQDEWVNVSRQKFDGLVGWDLIWCLYCDWMTGIWSLGSEMLRNVESFWCPIRFLSEKKCENCKTDFPDIEGGWIPAHGNIKDVAKLLEEKYPPGASHRFGWFKHPTRQTTKQPASPDSGPRDSSG